MNNHHRKILHVMRGSPPPDQPQPDEGQCNADPQVPGIRGSWRRRIRCSVAGGAGRSRPELDWKRLRKRDRVEGFPE
jgi:hypothetical protein